MGDSILDVHQKTLYQNLTEPISMNPNLNNGEPNSYPAIFAGSKVWHGCVSRNLSQKDPDSPALKKNCRLNPLGVHSSCFIITFPCFRNTGNLTSRTNSTAALAPYGGNSDYGRDVSDGILVPKDKSTHSSEAMDTGVACTPIALCLPNFKSCFLPNAFEYSGDLPKKTEAPIAPESLLGHGSIAWDMRTSMNEKLNLSLYENSPESFVKNPIPIA